MQEYTEEKAVNLAVTSTKVTGRVLYQALQKYMQHCKAKRQNKKVVKDTRIKGKQTVKQLIGQNQGVSSIPIGEAGIKDFERIAKKYGVDFAIVKDKNTKPYKYTTFFKARDADAIEKVLMEYSEKQIKKQKEKRPSVLEKLRKFKALVAGNHGREREKKKELVR